MVLARGACGEGFMDDIAQLLKGVHPSDVYHSRTTQPVLAIGHLVTTAGFSFYPLDGRQATHKADFLALAKTVFGFPQGTSLTWDGFFDRLRHIPWIDEQSMPELSKGTVVLFDHFEALAANAPEDFLILYGCFWEAFTVRWANTHYPAYVVLRGDITALPRTVGVLKTLSVP
jgi:hypothetical protein